MQGWLRLNLFRNEELPSSLLRGLRQSLADSFNAGGRAERDAVGSMLRVLGTVAGLNSVAQVQSYLAERGLWFSYLDVTPEPLVSLCPIVCITEGCKLVNYSDPKQGFVSTRTGEALIYTEVLLGDPVYTAGQCAVSPVGILVSGNVFIFTHVVRQHAKLMWQFIPPMKQLQPEHVQTFGKDFIIRGLCGIPSGQSLDWTQALRLLQIRWLCERFGLDKTEPGTCLADETRFSEEYLRDMRLRSAYHEIAGHYRDQIDHGHTLGTPRDLAGVYEVRAALAQVAFSDQPLYGVIELVTFLSEQGVYHHRHALRALSKLAYKVKPDLLSCDEIKPCEAIKLADFMASEDWARLREVAFTLLREDFTVRPERR